MPPKINANGISDSEFNASTGIAFRRDWALITVLTVGVAAVLLLSLWLCGCENNDGAKKGQKKGKKSHLAVKNVKDDTEDAEGEEGVERPSSAKDEQENEAGQPEEDMQSNLKKSPKVGKGKRKVAANPKLLVKKAAPKAKTAVKQTTDDETEANSDKDGLNSETALPGTTLPVTTTVKAATRPSTAVQGNREQSVNATELDDRTRAPFSAITQLVKSKTLRPAKTQVRTQKMTTEMSKFEPITQVTNTMGPGEATKVAASVKTAKHVAQPNKVCPTALKLGGKLRKKEASPALEGAYISMIPVTERKEKAKEVKRAKQAKVGKKAKLGTKAQKAKALPKVCRGAYKTLAFAESKVFDK